MSQSCQVSGRRRGRERLRGGAANSDEAEGEDLQANNSWRTPGAGQGKHPQDGVGRPSAWHTPGYLARGQLGWDSHVAGLRAPSSAAPSWHVEEHPQPGSESPSPRISPAAAPPRTLCPPSSFFFFFFLV